jgi:pimeloyl-ACP methyl ester carboxylesterase
MSNDRPSPLDRTSASQSKLTPEQILARAEAETTILLTPCGDGHLVWRRWGVGEPVVLLHGGYGSWRHWLRNIGPLSKQFTVYVPDMPGFGDSASPPEPYSPTTLAEILATGLERVLGTDSKFQLVGFSLGGTIAGELALLMPWNIRRLVIVGTSSLVPSRPERTEPIQWRTAGNPEAAHRHNLRSIMIADPARIDDVAVHIQAVNTAASRISSRKFRALRLLNQALTKLTVPRAGIWGEEDAMGRHALDAIREQIRGDDPTTPFEVIAGAGHWVPFERPEPFNAALIRILRLRPG